MKAKRSIISTFFSHIAIVVLSSLVIMIALWLYAIFFDKEVDVGSFFHFLGTLKSNEITLIFLFAIITTLIVTALIAKDLEKHFALFMHYFQDASKHFKEIDTQKLAFKEFESLALSVNNMVNDIKHSKEEVLKNKSYLQAVLEAQKNILFVIKDAEILSVNRAFLDFFSVESIKSFYNRYEKICEMFLDDEGYLQCSFDDNEWKNFIVENRATTHKVKLKKEDKVYVFIVDVSPIEGADKNQFVVSFTDITELETERERFERAASTDALTGIANRLKFNTILEQQIAFSKRYKEPFSLIMFDIDDFKRVNDTYGHQAGDEVLVVIAQSVSEMIRKSDTLARWGGEEFAIIVPQTKEKEAAKLADKIRKKIEKIRFAEGFRLTCSFGVKAYHDEIDSDIFIQETDALLYHAKSSGKNRVSFQSIS